jgi:metal-dependent HD superfamily phosphatase/phosphodiesterase
MSSTSPIPTPPQPRKIKVPILGNKILEKALDIINENQEVHTLWKVINVNAIDRMGMSDHGPVHFQIVANIALRLGRILQKNDVEMSITK